MLWSLAFVNGRKNYTTTTASYSDVIQSPGDPFRPGGRERGKVFIGNFLMMSVGIFDKGVRVTVLLDAARIFVYFLVHESARLVLDVVVARQFVEPLPVVAITVQLHELIILILATFRLDHLQH